jgi:hypothetical protein
MVFISYSSSASPFSSHPLAERWLSREAPAIGHGDCCNHDPRRGGICETNCQEGHPDIPGGAKIIVQAVTLACMSIATSRLPVRS